MSRLNRRQMICGTGSICAGALLSAPSVARCGAAVADCEEEILGQQPYRYRPQSYWGRLDRTRYPVRDCHGISEDTRGRIVLLTTETRNNLIAYEKSGKFSAAWENRFPTGHGLEITTFGGEERFWITDFDRRVVSMCTPGGNELRRLDAQALAAKYPDLASYRPTSCAPTPQGDLYVSDGYGSSFVHHFDAQWRLVASFGGAGSAPENLDTPHSVWIDTRGKKPSLLICDRGHAALKWFSMDGQLERTLELPGSEPCNVSRFGASEFIAVASLNGMVLIIDGADRVVSAVGADPPTYADGKLQPLRPFNYTFIHPHDVHVDAAGALYVAQYDSYQTYPIKLDRVP